MGNQSVLCVPGILAQRNHPMYEQVLDQCELAKAPCLDRLVFARDILQYRAWVSQHEDLLYRYASELADLKDLKPNDPTVKGIFLDGWDRWRSLEFLYRVAELFPESLLGS